MRTSLSLLPIIVIIFFSCNEKRCVTDIEYIKVFSIGDADSVTRYNKGSGLHNYLFYDFQTDRAIHRTYIIGEPPSYKTYAGHFSNKRYVDTLLSLVSALRKYGNGVVPDTVTVDGPYCGPQLFTEYKDKQGVHYNVFILLSDDTLNQFSDFFHRLNILPWRQKLIDNHSIKADTEVVTALTRLGFYEKKAMPYFSLSCDTGIDKPMLYGKWRQISGYTTGNEETYTMLTLSKNGVWAMDAVWDRISKGRSSIGKFVLNWKNNTITIDNEFGTLLFTILKLSDQCLEMKLESRNDTFRYDRLLNIHYPIKKISN